MSNEKIKNLLSKLQEEIGDTAVDDGRMSGDLLRFKTTRSMGERSFTASWSLTVEGESLEGTMSAGPMTMVLTGPGVGSDTAVKSAKISPPRARK